MNNYTHAHTEPSFPGAELSERVAHALGWSKTPIAGVWLDAYGNERPEPEFSTDPSVTFELLYELNQRGHRFAFTGNPNDGISINIIDGAQIKPGPVGKDGAHALSLLAIHILAPVA